MPETLQNSAVLAAHTLWVVARTHGLRVGWVSILEPVYVHRILSVPNGWKLIAYLCIGYPKANLFVPELLRRGWEDALPMRDIVVRR